MTIHKLTGCFIPILLILAQLSCNDPAPPDLPAARDLGNGVQFYEVTLRRSGTPMKIWLYLPKNPPAKLPCILIAPAGSRMFHGMRLADGDRAEHLPYVSKGFAVLAYEIDGECPETPTGAQASTAITAFLNVNAGVDNARAAIDYAEKKIPQIDQTHLYAVGHSSAATLALQVAQNDPRIAACVAMAPICDVPQHLRRFGATLDSVHPGTMDALEQLSPHHNIAKLNCPTMLFTAEDDTTAPTFNVVAFATELQKTNKRVKLVQVKSGGHYDSMINAGIPAGIGWLEGLQKK